MQEKNSNNDNFFSRLDRFMKINNLNDNKLTKITGIANGLIGKGRNRGGISHENISKILNSFPNLNGNWLLTGHGEMLLKDEYIKTNISISDNINLKNEDFLHMLEHKDEQIKALLNQNSELIKQINKLTDKL